MPSPQGWVVAVDDVTLSRIETEWLAACFYGRFQRMPRDVRERLKFLGLIDDRSELTPAGKRWMDERIPSGVRRPRST
jgi:hypothetical protein